MSADLPAVSSFMGLLPEEDFEWTSGRPVYCIGGVPKVEAGPLVQVRGYHGAVAGLPSTSGSLSFSPVYVGAISNTSPYQMAVIGRVAQCVVASASGITTPSATLSRFSWSTLLVAQLRSTGASPAGSVSTADTATANALDRRVRAEGWVPSLSDPSYTAYLSGAKFIPLPALAPGFAYDIWVLGSGFHVLGLGGTGTWRSISMSLFAHGVANGV